ncbi:MAG: hypothetical protein N2Z74_06450, partial [Syntrophales bacterium]|nr:hypothetical protein [Syntrophales bacterium]
MTAQPLPYVRFLIPVVVIMTLLGSTASGGARVYIDIDSPSFTKFPIAVTDFRRADPSADAAETVRFLTASLSQYLEMTGFFTIIPRGAFLADPARDNRVAFSDWTAIGTEYLVVGGLKVVNGMITGDMRLYDVVRGELVLEKAFSGRVQEKESLARELAAAILQALTGDGGVFSTRLAFVVKKGDVAEVHTIDFTGKTRERITNLQSLTLSPRWSPDGKRLSFTSYRDGNPDLYIADLKTGAIQKISSRPGLNLSGSWSPDGKKI